VVQCQKEKEEKVLGYALGNWIGFQTRPVLKCEELGPKPDQRFYQNFKNP
jgi:hypothetical protein